MPNTNQPSRKDGGNPPLPPTPPPIIVDTQDSSSVPKLQIPPTPQLVNVQNTQTPKK